MAKKVKNMVWRREISCPGLEMEFSHLKECHFFPGGLRECSLRQLTEKKFFEERLTCTEFRVILFKRTATAD